MKNRSAASFNCVGIYPNRYCVAMLPRMGGSAVGYFRLHGSNSHGRCCRSDVAGVINRITGACAWIELRLVGWFRVVTSCWHFSWKMIIPCGVLSSSLGWSQMIFFWHLIGEIESIKHAGSCIRFKTNRKIMLQLLQHQMTSCKYSHLPKHRNWPYLKCLCEF